MKNNKDKKINNNLSLLQMFVTMFKISLFTFGGGFVIISIMRKEFVEKRHCLTETDIQDITVIAQSIPGSLAVNASILIGYRLYKKRGIAATLSGTVLPPLLVLTVVSIFYSAFESSIIVASVLQGMQAAIAAVVLDAAITMCSTIIRKNNLIHTAILLFSILAVILFKLNAIILIIVCFAFGIINVIYNMFSSNNRSDTTSI